MLETNRNTSSLAKQSISFDSKAHYMDYKKVNIFESNINTSIMGCYSNNYYCNSASGRLPKQALLKHSRLVMVEIIRCTTFD